MPYFLFVSMARSKLYGTSKRIWEVFLALLRPPTDPLHQTCALAWLKTILTNFKTHIISCKEIPLKSSAQFHFSTVELWLRINWDWTLTHVMYCKITTFIWQMKLENGMIFFILTACTPDWSLETFSCITKFPKTLNTSIIAKCNETNDIQQADKLFADKRETTLQSIGGRVLMLVSVYRVSNTQQNKE